MLNICHFGRVFVFFGFRLKYIALNINIQKQNITLCDTKQTDELYKFTIYYFKFYYSPWVRWLVDHYGKMHLVNNALRFRNHIPR